MSVGHIPALNVAPLSSVVKPGQDRCEASPKHERGAHLKIGSGSSNTRRRRGDRIAIICSGAYGSYWHLADKRDVRFYVGYWG